ncbi:MAG: carbon starvation protein A [Phycisphaeraceae bacterium]|nr:carbon starvation protein A [Phycisphaeraceae bacterium]
MQTLLIAVLAGVAFIVAYHTYGRWLGSKVFNLAADVVCPSHRLRDDKDYVPTAKPIVFGHHFTSIAGTGPIVGPAIAVMWGWLPALLWVVLGSIFIGAVHDFGALVVSLRNNGQTVGDVAGRVLNRRVRLLFLLVLFMALTVVLAIFGLVIAAVFRSYPSAIFPCIIQIPIAVLIGLYLHRRGVGLFIPSLIALAIMYLSVIYGNTGLLGQFNMALKEWPMMRWVVVLLIYSYVASVLPVWTLLQPRDYINSLQLLTALGLIVLGLVVAAFTTGAAPGPDTAPQKLTIVAPMIDLNPARAPVIFPFLFITIACGAISGFHCLVSSGTSSKQLEREPDARFVGFGSMLTEGFLATLVILACVAGLGLGIASADGTVLTGVDAWNARYADWVSMGLPQKVGAFVDGAANFLKALGLSSAVAIALMGVLVASFAGTTLDTACRLQRYVVQELASTLLAPRAPQQDGNDPLFVANEDRLTANPASWLRNKHGATIFAVAVAVAMAAIPAAPGKPAGTGGLILWPMFGATNQLLGGLSFLVITFYLWRRRKPIFFLVLPLLFMLVMPAWAMVLSLDGWISERNWILITIAIATLVLEAWMIVEAVILMPRVKGVLEPELAGAAG